MAELGAGSVTLDCSFGRGDVGCSFGDVARGVVGHKHFTDQSAHAGYVGLNGVPIRNSKRVEFAKGRHLAVLGGHGGEIKD
jgi:hypothetical protein